MAHTREEEALGRGGQRLDQTEKVLLVLAVACT